MSLEVLILCRLLGVLVLGVLVTMSHVGQFQVISNFFGKIVHGIDADILVKVTSHTLNCSEDVGEEGVYGYAGNIP